MRRQRAMTADRDAADAAAPSLPRPAAPRDCPNISVSNAVHHNEQRKSQETRSTGEKENL